MWVLIEIGFLLAGIFEAAVMLVVGAVMLIVDMSIKGYDMVLAARTLERGKLKCPKGHTIEVVGTHTCAACSYTWEGTIFQCKNPECLARTPYVNCHCGLSVRSPWRYGRQP